MVRNMYTMHINILKNHTIIPIFCRREKSLKNVMHYITERDYFAHTDNISAISMQNHSSIAEIVEENKVSQSHTLIQNISEHKLTSFFFLLFFCA